MSTRRRPLSSSGPATDNIKQFSVSEHFCTRDPFDAPRPSLAFANHVSIPPPTLSRRPERRLPTRPDEIVPWPFLPVIKKLARTKCFTPRAGPGDEGQAGACLPAAHAEELPERGRSQGGHLGDAQVVDLIRARRFFYFIFWGGVSPTPWRCLSRRLSVVEICPLFICSSS